MKGIIFNPGCNIKTIYSTASTYCSCSSVSRFSMTFIEGLRLFLDTATVDKTESSKQELSVLAAISQRTKLRVLRNRA